MPLISLQIQIDLCTGRQTHGSADASIVYLRLHPPCMRVYLECCDVAVQLPDINKDAGTRTEIDTYTCMHMRIYIQTHVFVSTLGQSATSLRVSIEIDGERPCSPRRKKDERNSESLDVKPELRKVFLSKRIDLHTRNLYKSMYVYMLVYVCLSVDVCRQVSVYTAMYAAVCMSMYVGMYTYVCQCMYACTSMYPRM